VFARTLDDNLASLVKQLDKQVEANKSKKMAGFVVLLTEDPDAAEGELKAFAAKHGIKNIPLTIFDGSAGPENYKIAKEADVTVNLWVSQSSKANYAFAKGELDEDSIDAIVADTSKILN
jgi:hypothetical protein